MTLAYEEGLDSAVSDMQSDNVCLYMDDALGGSTYQDGTVTWVCEGPGNFALGLGLMMTRRGGQLVHIKGNYGFWMAVTRAMGNRFLHKTSL